MIPVRINKPCEILGSDAISFYYYSSDLDIHTSSVVGEIRKCAFSFLRLTSVGEDICGSVQVSTSLCAPISGVETRRMVAGESGEQSIWRDSMSIVVFILT